ncbi:Arrestin domain-containing protein 2 [Gryganskiella cystojenkinii]|nr:Arrestin domain-containing protein 2 [Gryganskiella cystojenkinii]
MSGHNVQTHNGAARPVGLPPSYTPHDETPPASPFSSPDRDTLVRTSSSSSSLDQLPPAMDAQGTTPAPSHEHSDMDAHTSSMVLEDDDHHEHDADREREDDEEDVRHTSIFSGRQRRSVRHPHQPPTASTSSRSQTTSTLLTQQLTHSVTASPTAYTYSPTVPPSRSDTGQSSSGPASTTVSQSHTSTSFPNSSTATPQQTSQNSISPFSFFSTHHEPQHPSSSGGGSKILKVELSQSEVVLKNGQMTSMTGTVYVNAYKPTKVKSLMLEFSGRSSVTWVDDNAYSPATRHTTAPHIEHSWTLIGHQHKQPPTVLAPGQHAFTFSLDLPETLPETLTTTHGKVSYRLTATLNKPGLGFNSSSVTIPVNILRRQSVQASRAYQRGGRATSSAEDKIAYKVTMPQIRVPHSTKVPLQVSITAPNTRTNISVLQVSLWERVVYRADGRKRVDMRLVKIQKSEGWARPPHEETEAVTWNKVLLFDMPSMGSDLTQCNPSADNGLMKVGHILKFSILGSEGPKRFRIENEIDLKVLAFEDEYRMDEEDEFEDEEEFAAMEAGEETEVVDGQSTRERRRRRHRGEDRDGLPSYLTSFSTPRVSFDSERDMDPADDDLLRAMLARIHLPTYAESESDSRNPSRDVSRNPSRDVSRNPSRAASRSTSPERGSSASLGGYSSIGMGTVVTASGPGIHQHHQHQHQHQHQQHHQHQHSLSHHPFQPASHSPLAGTPPRTASPTLEESASTNTNIDEPQQQQQQRVSPVSDLALPTQPPQQPRLSNTAPLLVDITDFTSVRSRSNLPSRLGNLSSTTATIRSEGLRIGGVDFPYFDLLGLVRSYPDLECLDLLGGIEEDVEEDVYNDDDGYDHQYRPIPPGDVKVLAQVLRESCPRLKPFTIEDPLQIPEILYLVGRFLPTKCIVDCLQVSHFWHDTFLPCIWTDLEVHVIDDDDHSLNLPTIEAIKKHAPYIHELGIWYTPNDDIDPSNSGSIKATTATTATTTDDDSTRRGTIALLYFTFPNLTDLYIRKSFRPQNYENIKNNNTLEPVICAFIRRHQEHLVAYANEDLATEDLMAVLKDCPRLKYVNVGHNLVIKDPALWVEEFEQVWSRQHTVSLVEPIPLGRVTPFAPSVPVEDWPQSQVKTEIQNLTLIHYNKTVYPIQHWILERCPELVQLRLESARTSHRVMRDLAELIRSGRSCQRLSELSLRSMETFSNEDFKALLEAMANIPKLEGTGGKGEGGLLLTELDFYLNKFNQESWTILRDSRPSQLQTLRSLNLGSCELLPRTVIQEILCSIPTLSNFYGTELRETEIKDPWVCMGLKHLSLTFKVPISSLKESQRRICARLAQLTQLEGLNSGFGIFKAVTPGEEGNVVAPWASINTSFAQAQSEEAAHLRLGTETFVPFRFSLGGGLDQLKVLTNIRIIGAIYQEKIEDEEAAWMLENWKKLDGGYQYRLLRQLYPEEEE